jgi:hypothetical protein
MSRYYKCNICNKKFTRKWNANRHNNNAHAGTSIIFNNETGQILDTKKLYPRHMIDKDYESETNDEVVLDIIGKMLQPFEELENLYANQSEMERTKHLSELLVVALKTSNPVKSLNFTLDFQRSMRAKIKFMDYISKSMNASPTAGESILEDLIKSNRLYQNKSNAEKGKIN